MDMDLGFEITTDDIIIVATQFGKQLTLEQANSIFDILDIDHAIDIALKEDTQVLQKQAAYRDLKEQMIETSVLDTF